MNHFPLSRRRFLQATVAAAGAAVASRAAAQDTTPIPIATNVYPWTTFYRREGRDFNAALDEGLREIAAAGLQGFEPILNVPADVKKLAPLLEEHGLEMRSFYVNTTLHEREEAKESVRRVLSVAKAAKPAGARIVVTNPNPIRWGGAEAKDDAQLELQARSLDRLGRELAALGLRLAYHNHDAELRNAAREFHHMMCGTDPEHVSLCLDAHWIYRGAGDSQLALFDIVKLYGPRISELHLRQSEGGVWTEAFGPGDIDYERLARRISEMDLKPNLVLEQAVEDGSPEELGALAAHRQGARYARGVFAALAG